MNDPADTKAPENQSDTGYSKDELPDPMFYKGIVRIESMLSMAYEFNQERVVENLFRFMGRKEKEISRMLSQSMNSISAAWIENS